MNNTYSSIFCRMLGLPLLAIIMAVQPAAASPQEGKIDFKAYNWEEANEAAEKEGKPIFFDVYQEKSPREDQVKAKETLFNNADVAAFFNEHFINVKMDMNSDRGRDFTPKLQMLMYPTMVIFGPNETQLAYSNIMSFEDDPEALLSWAREAQVAADRMIASNNSKTEFMEGKSWEELLAMSKEQNKPIVIDFYTTWCRPCIQMDRKVFTQDNVAKLYNENFILAKYDAEKGEGVELNERFEVWGYPTYVYLNSEGEQIHRVEGYTEADSMMIKANEALETFKASSRTSHIDFEPAEKTWAEIKAKAARENKLIFLDAYAVWCGPCKQMDRNVFTQQKVADFFNEHFINAKVDMEKGEGIMLKEEYNVTAYPTYVYVDASGREVHRTVGSTSADNFLEYARTALNPDNNLSALEAQFEQRPGDTEVVTRYLTALKTAYLSDKASRIAAAYLALQPEDELYREANWEIIETYVEDSGAEAFTFVVENRSKFYEELGKERVQGKITDTFQSSGLKFLDFSGEKATLDKKGFSAYKKAVRKAGLENADEIIRNAEIYNYQYMRQWDRYVKAINSGIEKQIIDPSALSLYNYALFASRYCEDEAILVEAAEWARTASEKPNIQDSFRSYYMDLQADLLEKAGREEEALAVRSAIDEQKLKEARDANPMRPLQIKQ